MVKWISILLVLLILLGLPFVFANTFMEENYAAVVSQVREGYPELQENYIEIHFKPLKEKSMAARPHPSFLFRKQENHRYKILVNTKYRPDSLVMINYSQDALVGITAHEFGHILDYSQMSDWEIIKTGWLYVFNKDFKIDFEHTADLHAIQHGFGEELLASVLTQYSLPTYWAHKEGVYYSPDEIAILIAQT